MDNSVGIESIEMSFFVHRKRITTSSEENLDGNGIEESYLLLKFGKELET